jgi:hypothetical protein
MDVRNFSTARDLLYLSGVLMGISLGYVLTLFRKNVTIRSRNRRITLILFVFSGVLTTFSAAVVVSLGEIFSSGGLFLAAAVCVPVFALAVCFPRTAAYPLILAGGLLVVWLGYSFLRFSLVAESGSPPVYVHHEEDNAYSVRISAAPGIRGDRAEKTAVPVVPAGDRAAVVALRISGNQAPLSIEGAFIRFHPWYPLLGGTERGFVTLVRQGNEILYSGPQPENSLLNSWYSRVGFLGIVFQNIGGTVPLDTIPRGTDLAVFFVEGALSLQPSR